MAQGTDDSQRFSFDEYRLYYESTEKVTDRRIATNTWNYGLCSALMVAIAGIASWASIRLDFRFVMLLAIVVLGGIGVLLSVLWTSQIRDFKELNAAKFEVLNSMAPSVRFGSDDAIVSANVFSREWEILNAREATREVTSMRIIALRSSNAEFLVPAAFRWLFILIMVIVVAILITNWTTLTSSIFDLRPPGVAVPSNMTTPGKP